VKKGLNENMSHKLNLGAWSSVFAVPAAVVDNYIKLAGGNNLKVLLFILRNAGSEIEADEISSSTGVKTDDVKDALLFWEQTGIFAMRENEIIPADMPIKSESVRPVTNFKKIELEREPRFCPKEIAGAVRGSKGMDFLFRECERIFGRPLRHNEQNSLMIITEDVGIPAECALMLVEYCASCGKATPAYMRRIAKDWHEREILSISQAEDEIKVLREIGSLENKLRRLFEMSNAFSKEQKDFIRKWSALGYDEEMIYEAYDLSLSQEVKKVFPYMDKIIENWKKDGIRNKEQLEQSQKNFKKAKQQTNNAKSSFDLDLISKLINEK